MRGRASHGIKGTAMPLTLQEVLKSAIRKEVSSHELYLKLGRKMNSQASKDAFRSLARQEKAHQHFLEDYLHGELKEGILEAGFIVDYKIADCLEQPDISPQMALKDVFLLAASREKSSYDLYSGLSSIHPAGSTRNLLKNLASQELEHKNRIETLYIEVAFPQTDGG
jgi:rubrerythrin